MTNHRQLNDDQMANLARNALIVAGLEMGNEGDHWPVINATIHSLMQDLENLKIERNVADSVRVHFRQMISELKTMRTEAPQNLKHHFDKAICDLEDIYDSAFTEPDPSQLVIDPESLPPHIHRAHAIISTLEAEDESV